jgi:hypothetical protein
MKAITDRLLMYEEAIATTRPAFKRACKGISALRTDVALIDGQLTVVRRS